MAAALSLTIRRMKVFLSLILLLLLVAGGAWLLAGRAAAPVIDIARPVSAIGQSSELIVTIDTLGAKLSRLEVELEQNGKRWPVFTLPGAAASELKAEGDRRLRLTQMIGKQRIPELQAGRARLVVSAGRKAWFGIRERMSVATRDVDVRLVPPTIAVLSTFHYINRGGSELAVYRVSPADVTSGVRVGELEYPGFPASGADATLSDPAMRVVLFALLWNQEVSAPVSVFARDEAGNEARAELDHRVFDKKFRNSRIELSDRFLAKVVPPILQNSPQLKVADPSDLLQSYLRINRDLRRENDATITALSRQTSAKILWDGPFKQLTNSAVEAGFADQRSYVYAGKVVDQQVHLGFDLASTAATPVHAANRGKVLHAGWLGIYGNCVILDHGLGLQSLYGHLSSIEVKVGDMIEKNASVGRSGSTGLAGGDHLHFTMLLDGHAVTPVDWWSEKWLQDRVLRKLHEAHEAALPAAVPK
jgi:murein DD-endopeptidase MepM/ murein hydrolase activator NlpD